MNIPLNRKDKLNQFYANEEIDLRSHCPVGKSKKIIKNCPCIDCGDYRNWVVETEKSRWDLYAKQETTSVEQLESSKYRLRAFMFRYRWLLLSVFLASLSSVFLKKVNDSADKVSPISSTSHQSLADLPTSSLLQRSSLQLSIPRSDIPAQLPDVLQGFGFVHTSPENYDPNLPNVYLIAQKHFLNMRETNQQTSELQADVLRIWSL